MTFKLILAILVVSAASSIPCIGTFITLSLTGRLRPLVMKPVAAVSVLCGIIRATGQPNLDFEFAVLALKNGDAGH
jgi:hypothetical protein